MDSASDFLDDDDDDEEQGQDQETSNPGIEGALIPAQPTKKHLAFATARSAETSLEILDLNLPKEPQSLPLEMLSGSPTQVPEMGNWEASPWLKEALLRAGAGADESISAGTTPLIARLPALAQRMRAILQRGVYGGKRFAKETCGGWAGDGRPAGFVGAGLAEELCLAIFGRIGALRSKGAGKQVCMSSA